MSVNDEHIDDLFRRRREELSPGTAGKDRHWEEMTNMLDQQPAPPKVRKKVTKRIITYLGVAALVTTVTYYSVIRKREYMPAAKTVHVPVTQPPSGIKVKQAPVKTGTDVAKIQPAVKANAAMPIRKPVKKQGSNLVFTKIKEESDTVWQHLKASPPEALSTSIPTNLVNFFRVQQPPEQSFDVTTGRDTLLFGNEGTVLKIPAFTFLDVYNRPVKGQVQIKLTECYNYADMFAHRLTTTSNGEPLVTGGMVKIDATQDGKPLRIQSYQPISIAMPMDRYDPGMQLFLPAVPELKISAPQPVLKKDSLFVKVPGNKDSTVWIASAVQEIKGDTITATPAVGVNWVPAGQRQALTIYKSYVAAKQVKLFDLRQRIKGINGGDEASFLVRTFSNIPDDKIKQLIQLRYNAAGYKRVHIERVNSFEDEVKGKDTRVLISKGGFVAGDSVMMNFVQAMKENLVNSSDSIRFMQKLRIDSIEFFEKWRSDSIAYVRRLEFNKAYSFDITGLGWINCDRFMNRGQPQLEFTIKIDPGTHKGGSDYKLIFTNMKSVLPGHYESGLVNFGLVPVGEPVQVVCVSENDGKPIACIQKAVTGKEAIARLVFEPVTPALFRERLLQLK